MRRPHNTQTLFCFPLFLHSKNPGSFTHTPKKLDLYIVLYRGVCVPFPITQQHNALATHHTHGRSHKETSYYKRRRTISALHKTTQRLSFLFAFVEIQKGLGFPHIFICFVSRGQQTNKLGHTSYTKVVF